MTRCPPIYCLNFNNPVRQASMRHRLANMPYFFYSGVPLTDPRICPELDPHTQKCHSCMFGHLDMIRDFVNNSTEPHAIFCEDDILINAKFMKHIATVVCDFELQDLDVLLLGYLVPYVISGNAHYGFNATVGTDNIFRYYDYPPETIWGTQMYMLSRKNAERILDTYGCPEKCIDVPFSADWTITQTGNKRIIYPMLAIEDGQSVYNHPGQARFHEASHKAHLQVANYI